MTREKKHFPDEDFMIRVLFILRTARGHAIGSGGPASHLGGSSSTPGQSMWDLVDEAPLRLSFLRVLLFSPVSIFPPWLSVLIYHLRDEQQTR
jgi:hypothetical protein